MTIPTPTRSVSKRVSDLLEQMTLDEKLAQIGSYWMYDLQTKGQLDQQKIAEKLKHGIGQITRLGGASTLDPQSAANAANVIQRFLVEQTRLAIPAIVHEECCSGAMVVGGSTYPQMLGVASTFQPELAEQITTVIRKQLRAIGAHQGLAPVLDVARDPRWGRVEETFGEDPTLVSHFGTAYVRGLQGHDFTEGIMATGKHFVGHSFSQGGLNCAPVQIGIGELYNVYLAPFQAAIRDAKLASIMNAYPELDGEVVSTSRHILTDLLRGTLGFDGLVVSDYHAINMVHEYHKTAPDKPTAARLALNAGIDVELPSSDYYAGPLRTALEAGEINLELLDTAVARHLQKKFELGLFESPYVDEDHVYETFETTEQRALAQEVARKSIVLLKNDGLLPLKKSIGTLAVIGPNADDGRNQLGDYSYAAMSALMQFSKPENSSFLETDPADLEEASIRVVTTLAAIRETVSPDTRILYARGCGNLADDRSGFAEALHAAEQADVVVLVLGDRAGLTPDCTTGEFRDSADLRLPGLQEELAKEILATGKPAVAALVNGRPYALPWLEETANAILEAWLPGEEGGKAIAEVLFGEVNPGGKLPITFPRHVGQVPIFYNHKPSGMRSNPYVDYVSEKVTPLYAFGHGLSYTSFEYAGLVIGSKQAARGETVDISFSVKNIGEMAGEEVVQLYIRDEYASSPRPVKELKGYRRLLLNPCETKQITFHLPVDQLAFYDVHSQLVVEAGRIEVMIGSSSSDIRLRGEFDIIGEQTAQVRERIFECPVDVQ